MQNTPVVDGGGRWETLTVTLETNVNKCHPSCAQVDCEHFILIVIFIIFLSNFNSHMCAMDKVCVNKNQVILSVKIGRGFDFLDFLIIEASLNSHTLETDIVQSENEILIGAELLWEMEKNVLKRLRTGNVPLKVECFSVINGKKQDKIGYILLTLRAAKTVPQNSGLPNVPGVWYSLLGVKTDVKSYCPSLLLSLCIEDPSITSNLSISKRNINSTDNSMLEYVPSLFSNNDLMQAGPCQLTTGTFLLSVIIDSATDLNLLADSDTETTGNFTFSCVLMGCTRTGATVKSLSSFSLNEENKFSVKVSSTLKSLRDYFQKQKLASIKITASGQEIAFGDINASNLIPIDDLQVFLSQYSTQNTLTLRSRCYLLKSVTHQIPVSSKGSRPYIDTMITLQYLCSNSNKGLGEGDAERSNAPDTPNDLISLCPNITRNLKETNLFICGAQEEHSNMQDWFMLNITVESILVHTISCVDTFSFRFNHTNARAVWKHHQQVVIDKANKFIPVQGVSCSLFLQGTLQEVQQEFITHKPLVELLGIVDKDCISFACSEIDIRPLCKDQVECCVKVNLKGVSQKREFGDLIIKMSLEKVMVLCSQKMQISMSESNIVPSLYAHATERALKEIEEWKKQQKELFLVELKKKELEHLDAVVEDWVNCQKEYESALNNSVQHCTELTASLSRATNELRCKSQIIAEKETELSQVQKALEAEYQAKLQECREASRRMEDDFRLEISGLQRENKCLLDQIALHEQENACLLKVQKDLENAFERLKKCSLTEDQTATLLKELKLTEEKYETAYRSKIFFKEQWARAIREIHIIKSMHREEVNMQIRSNREELKFLGRMLPSCESSHQPHTSPPQCTTTINTVSRPETIASASNHILDSLFNLPHRSLSNKEDTSNVLQKSTLENKLQELVQERDSLLNTGTIALDHVLITKLNTQIRQLLASPTTKLCDV